VPVICLAIIGAGGIFVGANPGYTETELLHVLTTAKVKFVLSEPEIVSSMRAAMTKRGLDVDRNLFIFEHLKDTAAPPGSRSWKWLQQQGEEDWTRFNDQQRQTSTVAGYFFTSGTTGLPKCAMVSHRNLVAEHQIFWTPNPRDYKIRTVHVFPLYHIGAFPTVIVSQLKDGREAYIVRRFVLEPWLSYHEKYQITEVFLAPPMVVQVTMSQLADPASSNYKYSLKSVRTGYIGAAPLSGDIQKRFHNLLSPGARLTQVRSA
jgi:4-coumarate--CoA ligase